jgi:hypothetical protein
VPRQGSISVRLTALEAAVRGFTAAAPAGGPATRIKSDYGPTGPSKKGGGRKVASKAGEKRYGLPIGTPLGQTGSKAKNDAATQASYNTFMSAATPADQRKAAAWMSTGDLKRAGEALFSFQSKNERDEAARLALVKELADRGIDPHSIGYKGGPVVLNPNPKQDPVEKAAATVQRKADTAKRQEESAAKKAASDAERAIKDADTAKKKATKDATTEATAKAKQALAQSIAEGAITEAEARRRMQQLARSG